MSPRTIIESPEGPPTFGLLSAAVRAGDFVFVSGNVGLITNLDARENSRLTAGDTIEGGMREQTRQVLDNIRVALHAAAASLDDVVKINAYLTNPERDFDAYNEVYREFFPAQKPARTSIGASLHGDFLVEMDCVAYAPLADR